MLSCLLFSSLIFSATLGVLHRHGSSSSYHASFGSPGVYAASLAGGPGTSTDDPLQSKDCSICQLHRQLSGGLIYGPVFLPVPPDRPAPALVSSVTYHSATATPRRGRAPPQTSL